MESQTEFYRAFTLSRQEAGLGARCPICGGCVRYGLEPGKTTFEHCGRKELAPKELKDLPSRSLRRGMPELPKGFMVMDTWDDVGGWDEDSAAKSDDPGAFEVSWV